MPGWNPEPHGKSPITKLHPSPGCVLFQFSDRTQSVLRATWRPCINFGPRVHFLFPWETRLASQIARALSKGPRLALGAEAKASRAMPVPPPRRKRAQTATRAREENGGPSSRRARRLRTAAAPPGPRRRYGRWRRRAERPRRHTAPPRAPARVSGEPGSGPASPLQAAPDRQPLRRPHPRSVLSLQPFVSRRASGGTRERALRLAPAPEGGAPRPGSGVGSGRSPRPALAPPPPAISCSSASPGPARGLRVMDARKLAQQSLESRGLQLWAGPRGAPGLACAVPGVQSRSVPADRRAHPKSCLQCQAGPRGASRNSSRA
uniref:serine/arginine repetitive matrix protein 1-like n=1 Tax=Ictidomys tridecemlineatus TaxID=43179 RepID=UPI001A9DE028|nr:serine/arginine repetitive matrix protein 1-like [Ictidomys tridecemlineatus]